MNYSLNGSKSSNAHFSWRINRIAPARILRTLFPKPYIMTKWSGQSVERYVFIDEPAAHAYKLPSFECSYVFLIQGSGQRVIVLKPSKECGEVCKTVSVVLKSSYVCKFLLVLFSIVLNLLFTFKLSNYFSRFFFKYGTTGGIGDPLVFPMRIQRKLPYLT